MTDSRPYATLLAKGEDRRQLILAVAQRSLTRSGWRNTTLARIAEEAGVTAAGVLHHFQSKEQLLHALLDARDADDEASSDQSGDLIEGIRTTADRIEHSPELVGMFVVLLAENLFPGTPLHERMLNRWRTAIDIVSDSIRRGQDAGQYRDDFDPRIRAVEIIAFITGMEISWLIDHSISLTAVFNDYARALERDITAEGRS
ncbi:TetR/AcrR family transcriptional regulator [Aldersonia sp. NBC_00410]|uniref:TetR/AcrR family transcriptional regulator n=1 Tax=Aldersonia sp. NBC_00410 TaxID=2975954 RepID=UPI00224F7019|nr:TetR/AcrR family transcriptional regulator [Aldersonia sp. NBC_00410]MCX5044273.1 TetR/AcrR family transcriptional regulator [Aldersonia sp. NBC_00410]